MATVWAGGAIAVTWSAGSSTIRTPRAAAVSRAAQVMMAPTATRSSPEAGMSCAVMTGFMVENGGLPIQDRCTIRKDHCNETASDVVRAGGVGRAKRAPDGELQRKPLQPPPRNIARRRNPVRSGPGGDPDFRIAAAVEAGRR